jgi:hypothetical protein
MNDADRVQLRAELEPVRSRWRVHFVEIAVDSRQLSATRPCDSH